MVATLPKRKPKLPTLPSLTGKQSKRPEKCTVGMQCQGECVSKADPRSGKAKRCRGQSSGMGKQGLEWLLANGKTGEAIQALPKVNREGSYRGEGRLSIQNGKVKQEDLSQYLTNQTGRKFTPKNPVPSRKPVPPTLTKINSLKEKASQAIAIAENTTAPDIKARAKTVADRFKALIDRVQSWEKGRRQRVRNARKSNAGTLIEPKAPTPPSKAQTDKPSFNSQAPTKPLSKKPILPRLPQQVDSPNIPPISKFKNAQPIGKGQYGVVYRNGDKVVKYATQGTINQSEYDLGNKAHALGVAPKIYELGQSDGRSAMVMQAVDGQTILEKYRQNKYIDGQDIDDGLSILRNLHSNNISHGDLHVGNLIRDNDGKLQAIDWGRAREGDTTRMMKEMVRPYFIFQARYSDKAKNGVEYVPYQQKDSKLIGRFRSAHKAFFDKYGTDVDGWPQGKDAEKAIGNFYSTIFPPPQSPIKKQSPIRPGNDPDNTTSSTKVNAAPKQEQRQASSSGRAKMRRLEKKYEQNDAEINIAYREWKSTSDTTKKTPLIKNTSN